MIEQPRIRRATATAEELRARQQYALVPSHSKDDEIRDEQPQRLPSSARRYQQPAVKREYLIPLVDGTTLRVTERQLATMGQDYQDAAQLVNPQVATKHQRQPHPKHPIQDDSVIYAGPARKTDLLPKQSHRPHWLLFVGLSMIATIAIWLGLLWVGAWWQVQQDDWQYGRPRTFQTDYNVGHGTAQDPNSHFIAMNLKRHIEVMEIPADNASKTKIYVGPTLIGASEDLTPVTLSFEDVNHDGRPDLVIHVADSKYLFLNQNGTFTPAPNQ